MKVLMNVVDRHDRRDKARAGMNIAISFGIALVTTASLTKSMMP
jgi:hypothetical protein